jgi:hypothetical protein
MHPHLYNVAHRRFVTGFFDILFTASRSAAAQSKNA